jgi:hypothetical protein
MFKKVCFSPESDAVATHTSAEISANPKLVERMTKLANGIKTIAPRSDDFLYFSIIFLKAAESAILNDSGAIKKTSSGENAWGFFDENWKWHGNVKPHKNNNNDIFPESELKIAAKKWIGMPLCRDHESSSVDGIRGIILDAHYDEKFKQVIGLCALDKINYPDLARKVETGLVRYGSMGTAVETSICSDCGNRAQTQKEYCEHVNNRLAHGEINVGLKPIEYSLVVQPAEPGAVLLKCIASLQGYKQELSNYGVDNVDEMLGKLSSGQAQHLEGIMKTACGDTGCSVSERKKIVRSFLKNNSLLKGSHLTEGALGENSSNTDPAGLSERLRSATEAAKALADPDVPEDARRILSSLLRKIKTEEQLEGQIEGKETSRPQVSQESFTSPENTEGARGSGGVPLFSAAPSNSDANMLGGGDTGNGPDFLSSDDDILVNRIGSFNNSSGGEAVTVATSRENHSIKVASNSLDNDYVDDFSINSLMEDIMNESRLRKRAELRRRIAYMQGGAEGAEPNTYKSEAWDRDQDKQMKQTGSMGGSDGMAPGDRETKEKLSRAKLKERRLKRLAYMQGGSEGVEPSTYKNETWDRSQDKHMHQTGNMGGADGTFPGDKEAKEKLSRAAYRGPGLRTRFSVKRRTDGSVDRSNSVFEVFAGDRRVIAATAGQIYRDELAKNWKWVSSKDYGKEVCSQIREAGLDSVARLLKTAQEMPELPMMEDAGEMPPMEGAGEMPPMEDAGEMPEMPPMDDAGEGLEAGEDEDLAPSEEIENRLADMEQILDEIRDYVSKLEDERLADVDVNVFTGKGKDGGETVEAVDGGLGTLSSELIRGLKTAYRRLDSSADELSLVAETYDNISKLSAENKVQFKKLAQAAVKDADHLTGESRGLMKLAISEMQQSVQSDNNVDDLSQAKDFALDYAEDNAQDHVEDDAQDYVEDDAQDYVEDEAMDEADDGLVAAAMDLRRTRRNSLLKQSEDRFLAERAASRASILKQAEESGAPDEVAEDALEAEASGRNLVKTILDTKIAEKRVDEDRENYRVKLRRAYDVGLEMQRKGLLAHSKTALDKQVDEIMTFDGNAFEAFKRSIGNARSVGTVKIASDLGGINIGVSPDQTPRDTSDRYMTADTLTSMWE